MKALTLSSVLLMILGLALDKCHITPIIKNIATSSFVLLSGGICIALSVIVNQLLKYKIIAAL